MLVKGSDYIKSVLQRSAENGSNQSGNESIPTNQTRMTLDEAMSTQPVLDALTMGLNAGRIKSVVQRRLQLIGRPFNDTETLVSAVLDGQIEDEGFEVPESNRVIESEVAHILHSALSSVEHFEGRESTPSTSSSSVPEIIKDNSSISPIPSEGTNISRMKNVECKICMDEEVGVVFLPCGHLLSCVMCAPAITNCPLCRREIQSKKLTAFFDKFLMIDCFCRSS
jgi:baculoviral IAP repeat-containing protein 2/3